jgi:hypothetical protein
LYSALGVLVTVLVGSAHASSVRAVSALVWSLLLCQSLHVADLSRAVPGLKAARARQGMRRVRRVLGRSVLMSERVAPHLVRIALRLVGASEVTLVLDSTRCRRWEVFTLGVVFHGRVLPIAWSILPYPWPKKQFTPTVVALVDRVLGCWPSTRGVHLVADRGFPSLKLFGCLESWRGRLRLGYTIRLRSGDWVLLADGRVIRLKDLLGVRECTHDECIPLVSGHWSIQSASYQHQGKPSPSAGLVIGQSEPSYPRHQQGPKDVARRLARAQRRRAHLLSKGQPRAPETDRVWLLLTTAPTIEAARAVYGLRFHTEGMYRDLKEWDLEVVAGHESDQHHLDGLLGLAALGYVIQSAIGAAAGCASSEALARQHQWCTTDRLSVFWRGRQVLHDHAFDWRPWLHSALPTLTSDLAPPSTTNLTAEEAA